MCVCVFFHPIAKESEGVWRAREDLECTLLRSAYSEKWRQAKRWDSRSSGCALQTHTIDIDCIALTCNRLWYEAIGLPFRCAVVHATIIDHGSQSCESLCYYHARSSKCLCVRRRGEKYQHLWTLYTATINWLGLITWNRVSSIQSTPSLLINLSLHTQFLHHQTSSPVTKLPPLTHPSSGKKYGGRSLYNYRQSQKVQDIVSGIV